MTYTVIATLLRPTVDAQSIVTIAGGGSDEGRPATLTGLNFPRGVAVDSSGNIYFADSYKHRIRKVAVGSGLISTVAGNGSQGFSGDGGPATLAGLFIPEDVTLDVNGNLYIADTFNHRIRKVTAGTGMISTVAGSSAGKGFSGDGGSATAAALSVPSGVAIDSAGDFYIADAGNNRIRRVDGRNGIISTVAGNGIGGFSGDQGPATAAALFTFDPSISTKAGDVAVDASGNLYIADYFNRRIRKVAVETGFISTIAGNGSEEFAGDDGPATLAALARPDSLALDRAGNLYVPDQGRIRRIDHGSGIISTIAGNGTYGFSGDGGPAIGASLTSPHGVTVDSTGNLYFADYQRIRRVETPGGDISTVAGNGIYGFLGDDGPATAAALQRPLGLAVDAAGNLYIADYDSGHVRKVARQGGRISTVAGNGDPRISGDGGPATAAGLSPHAVAVDTSGNLFIADEHNNRVRRVDGGTGTITTVAGIGPSGYGSGTFSGDDGPATAAGLSSPRGVALDTSGNLYIADELNHRVRKVNLASGVISTVAGTGKQGFSGDGGPATAAQLAWPSCVAVDAVGSLYIGDLGNTRVRKVATGSGIITTTTSVYSFGLALDAGRNLFASDILNHRIRKIVASSGATSTVAGSGASAFFGDNGPATAAGLSAPYGIAVDSLGNLFIASGERVRAVLACVNVSPVILSTPSHASAGIGPSPLLDWQEANGAFRYDVYLDTKNPPVTLIESNVTASSLGAQDLTSLTTYYWRVVAKGDPFCSPTSSSVSEVWSFTTTLSCAKPGTFVGDLP